MHGDPVMYSADIQALIERIGKYCYIDDIALLPFRESSPSMTSQSRRRNLLVGLALGFALLLLSYARIIGDSHSMAFREEVLDTIFAGSIMGTKLMANLIWCGIALTGLHLGFGLLCWGLGATTAVLFPKPGVEMLKHERQCMVLWFALLTVALLAFNAAEFSRSSLGSAYAIPMMLPIAGFALGKWIGAV
ncbi:MAG TPA: hypothetical protein VFZ95_13605, partial [Steroidobacteraceae bacterium]